ncbi:MAG: glycosyltransferase family 39 protein [Cryomorphaceae bacterium]
MRTKDHTVIFLLSALFFLPFLGAVHLFDWDEINFAESAREMLLTGNWFQVQINFQPFWEKPPLFFWLQALGMHILGVSEYAARLPNAVAGLITLQVIFMIGKRWHDRRFAWIWVLLYLGSFLPHLYFRSGIIDPWFNLFIFLSVYFLYLVLEHGPTNRSRNALLAGMFSGLAILTKGPVGLLILMLTFLVWLGAKKFRPHIPWKEVAFFTLACFAVTTFWFGFETFKNGPWFLNEFLAYQVDLLLNPVAGHKQPFFYHFAVVLLGCFPLSVLALPSFSTSFSGDSNAFSRWMKFLFWVVMILFSLVTTKIVHYSSMAYLPLAYLAALVVHRWIVSGQEIRSWQRHWILFQGGIIGFAIMALPILLAWKEKWLHWITDPFVRENFSVEVQISGWEWLIGAGYLFCVFVTWIWIREQPLRAIRLLTLSTATTIFFTLLVLVPKIERITQGSTISFFEQHSQQDVYLDTYGYKSYAHYFYGKVTSVSAHTMDEHALHGADKRVFISVRMNRIERFMDEYPNAVFLYDAGGFHFYRLDP